MERFSIPIATSTIYDRRSVGISAYIHVKCGFYYLCKWIGLFRLSRRITRRGMRILCYHGFSLVDESDFGPTTFMSLSTFRKRLEFLRRKNFPVLMLGEALDLLGRGTLPDETVVITIDDGFFSVYRCAYPLLGEFSFPFTLYITSYYAIKKSPIFRLVIQYMMWKTEKQEIDLGGLGLGDGGRMSIRTQREKREVMFRIIRYGEIDLDEPGRCELAEKLAERFGVDYKQIVEERILSIVNRDEIAEMVIDGVDIQLHTHRHNLPLDKNDMRAELDENRSFLEPITKKRLVHFCYPSGYWNEQHLPWLSEAGIESAVTCKDGLNYPETPRLLLNRFLDSERVSSIEFEAALCGFTEVVRNISSSVGRVFRK
jgi:peptidoglycan/xylan/chitin deacetylase (PgdA/CDA1 family)